MHQALKKLESELSRNDADATIKFNQELLTLQQKQAADEDSANKDLKDAERRHSKAKTDASNNAVNAKINLHATDGGLRGTLAVQAKEAINSATSESPFLVA